MSYDEYLDLFILAQKNTDAMYYVVSFDTVNSKLLSKDKREALKNNIFSIVKYVYEKLLQKEKELNRQVVIHDERFYTPWSNEALVSLNHNYLDPSIFGDNFAFTIFRDTVSKDEIVEWVNECKRKLNMEEEFHIADGYYETNNYGEGGSKLYRGYCLQILERFHKPELQLRFKRVQKRLERK